MVLWDCSLWRRSLVCLFGGCLQLLSFLPLENSSVLICYSQMPSLTCCAPNVCVPCSNTCIQATCGFILRLARCSFPSHPVNATDLRQCCSMASHERIMLHAPETSGKSNAADSPSPNTGRGSKPRQDVFKSRGRCSSKGMQSCSTTWPKDYCFQ